MKKITILVLCATVFLSMANAKNIFVDPTNGSDAASRGTTWELAVKTLAGAVNATYVGTLTAGDNIYVKGGSLTTLTGAFTTNTTVNYYGGYDLSNIGTTTTRTTNDNDGNGIIEPWEFLNPTTFTSTANANGSVAIKINNAGYTFDGFTLTHNATAAASNYIRSIEISGTNTNFCNCIIKNTAVTYSISGFGGTPYNMLFSAGSGAIVNNCLFEKNNVSYTTTTINAAYPFINISSASFTNCIVRNNLVTVNASAANAVRSMLICLYASSTTISTIKNCVIHNNEMVYNGTGGTTSDVGAAINVFGVDGSESIINCTIANNKSTNVPIAGMKTTSRTGMNNTILNNVLWNNISGASTIANFTIGANMIATSSISKNVMNGGQTVTENGTTIKYNDFALSTANATGVNQALFKTPTTIVGSSLGSLAVTDSTTIKQSVWQIKPGSYLAAKGVSVSTNPTDKSGTNFSASPAIGAYEGLSAPVVSAITPTSTQLSVAFTAGNNGGSSITNYKYSTDGGVNFTACAPTQTTSPINITGLANGTSYNVQIKATNELGDGVATSSVAASPSASTAVPAAPTINSITSGNAKLTVAFTPASDNGSAITNYKYSTDGTNFTDCSPAQTTSPIVINGLTNGTACTVKIQAVNAIGDGIATASITATPYTVPDAPTGLVATAGNAQVSVAFTIPTNTGGSPITSYVLTSSGGSSTVGTGSPILFTSLTNDKAYTFTVTAINAAGAGVASSGVSATPSVVAIPNAPTLGAATITNGQVSFVLTAPAILGGQTITSYKYSIDGGATYNNRQTGTTGTPLLITGLTNGTTYSISVKAAYGTSPFSDGLACSAVATTIFSAPNAPNITGITASSGSLSVAFTTVTNGSTISNYKYSLNGGAFTALGTAKATSPITIPGLTNGTLYNVQIKAVSNNGDGAASAIYTAPIYSTTPAAPTISGITAAAGQLSVAFTAGSNGGSTITNYKYSTDGGTSFALASSTSSPLEITTLSTDGTTLLTNGTAYNVQIKAVNANGDGTATGSTAVTPIFAAPTSTAASALSSTGFTANWTAASQGPSATYTYTVQYGTVADLSSGTTSISSIGSSTFSQVIGSLSETTPYYYRVMVTNGTVSSAWSTIQPATTLGTQTLTWSQSLTGLKLGDSSVTLTATSSAVTNAAPITYVSSNTSVVNVSGSTLTVVGPGTATVTAQQAANTYYEAAVDVIQNVTVSLINAGFEDATSGYTFSESSINVLRRVDYIYDVTTQTSAPASTPATSITNGMWIKKATNTSYIKGAIVTTDPHAGSSCLNLKITVGTPTNTLDNWNSVIALQKLSLSNTQKYTVSFWAKIDATASNVASTVTAFIMDNTKRTSLSCAIPLTGGTTWTQYTAIFDIPTFKAANATADFSTAFMGIGLTGTYDAATLKTNYSGVLLDDFSVTPTTATTFAVTSTAGTGGTVTNGGVYTSGTNATVVAAPSYGYKFVNWTLNTSGGTVQSTSPTYTFNVTEATTLVANFEATNTTCTLSTSTLTGFTYNNGAGPSAEQSFTVTGTNLLSNVVISPTSNYQISTASGASFVSTNPILLTNTGTLASTTIYVRLKAGLAVNNFNSENINISTLSLQNKSVTSSGNVTTNPNLAFATPTSVSKNYGDAAFTNSASSSLSSGAVTYASGSTAVATIDANSGLVSIVGAGSSIITATIAANGTYGAATKTYTLNVAVKALTVTAVSSTKTYDGNTSSLGTPTVGALASGDVINVAAIQTYDNKNYGTTHVLTPLGLTIKDGSNADKTANYSITYTPSPATGVIDKLGLTIGAASIASKMYDDSATSGIVTPGTLSGFVSSETVTVNTAVGTYSDATVGTDKSATIVYTLANGENGGLAINYSLANGSANGDITSATIIGTKTASVLTSPTADVTIAGTSTVLTMDNSKTVKNLTLSEGAEIKLSGANTLTVNGNLDLKADLTTSFSLNLGSSSVSVPTGTVRYIKTIDDQKWYFIAFPCDIAISGIRKADGSSMGVLGTDWYIKYYDGSRRATQGTTNGVNWFGLSSVDYTAELSTFKLNANQGYIIGLAGNTHATVDIAFPIDKSYLANETDAARTKVPVTAFTGPKSNDNGWNLIGQPYLSKFKGIDAVDVNYMLFSDGTSSYSTCSVFDGTLAAKIIDPFTAYFVQAGSTTDIAFSTTGRQGVKSMVEQSLTQLVQLNMTTPTGTDYTSLILDDTQSTEYQIGQDMEKWIGIGTAKPQVYTVLGGINYAFNALPISSVTNLPLGIYTQTASSTTISVDATKATSLTRLLLIDNGTSPATVTDLLSSNYTFIAATGTNNTRFQITAQRVATENIAMGNELGEIQLIINNSKLVINNLDAKANVRVFDAIGRMVINKTVRNNSLEVNLSAKGMYTVQIEVGGKNWVKKIVN
jgi:predicted RNA-binding protein with TRAM domain